jgi:hypothetical protein
VVVGHPTAGTRHGWNRAARSDSPSLAPIHRGSAPVHTMLTPAPADPPLRCRAVSPTPIYDQLRGERINADVPATGTEPQQVGHLGKHRQSTDGSDPAGVLGRSPEAGVDLDVGLCWFAAAEPAMQAAVNATWRAESARETRPCERTYPASQPAGSGETPAGRESQVAAPSTVHARQEQAQLSSGRRALEAVHNPAAQGAVADGRGAHPGKGCGPRHAAHTEPRFAAPVGVQ